MIITSRFIGVFILFIYLCSELIKFPMEKENKTKELLKRNNQAPNFPTNIIKSRAELLVEMFVQKMEFDLQEYIEAQRIFKINIPTKILKEWYPTPTWKKDV